jgi:hypothetical protein
MVEVLSRWHPFIEQCKRLLLALTCPETDQSFLREVKKDVDSALVVRRDSRGFQGLVHRSSGEALSIPQRTNEDLSAACESLFIQFKLSIATGAALDNTRRE